MRASHLCALSVSVLCSLTHASQQEPARAIIAEMLADADTRTSMLSGAVAPERARGWGEHDGRFTLRDNAGNFSLAIGGHMQTRYTLNLHDDTATTDGVEPGFSLRRTKLKLSGHVFTPDITFKVQSAFSRSSATHTLEVARINIKLDNYHTISFGQSKTRFLREENISSMKQLTADRSLTNEIFKQSYSQHVELSHTAEKWRAWLSFSDGLRSRNTPFDSPQSPSVFAGAASGGEADFAVTARIEVKTGANWKRFDDFTSPPGQEFAALFGAALHFEGGDASTTTFASSYSFLTWTADLSLEGDAWSAYAAAIGAHTANGLNASDTDDYGFLVQGAFYLPDSGTEFFARYDILFPDSSRSMDDPFDTITMGFNHYLHAHAAKFTADIQWFLSDVNALSGSNTGVGYLSSAEPNEIAIRLQFQILF